MNTIPGARVADLLGKQAQVMAALTENSSAWHAASFVFHYLAMMSCTDIVTETGKAA